MSEITYTDIINAIAFYSVGVGPVGELYEDGTITEDKRNEIITYAASRLKGLFEEQKRSWAENDPMPLTKILDYYNLLSNSAHIPYPVADTEEIEFSIKHVHTKSHV